MLIFRAAARPTVKLGLHSAGDKSVYLGPPSLSILGKNRVIDDVVQTFEVILIKLKIPDAVLSEITLVALSKPGILRFQVARILLEGATHGSCTWAYIVESLLIDLLAACPLRIEATSDVGIRRLGSRRTCCASHKQ